MECLIIPKRLIDLFLYQNHSPIRGVIVEDSGDGKFFFPLRGVELYPVSSLDMVPERETLCNENGLTRCKLLQYRPRISAREPNDLQVEKDLSIHRGNDGRIPLIFNLKCPEGINGFDTRKRRKRPGDLERKESGVSCNRIGTREDEHIT